VKIIRRKVENKIEDIFGENQFGRRTGNGTSDATEMLRLISEQTF
jgi:hypothetical protein